MIARATKMSPFVYRLAVLGFVIAVAPAGPAAFAQNVVPQVPAPARIIHIAASPDGAPQHLSLSLNNAAIIELDKDARDVFVANPKIVDAVVRSPRRIFVMALGLGETNAILLDAAGRQIATIEISVNSDVTSLNTQLVQKLPGDHVNAQGLKDGVVLGGTVKSLNDAAQAQELAQRFAGTPDKVVNTLKIDQKSQVLIKVRVSEMSRTIAKQLGVNVSAAGSAGGVPVFASTDNQFSLLGRALADLSGTRIGSVGPDCLANGLATACTPSPNNAQGVLKALEEVGLVHTLAEPNLTAVSGEAAKFLAGGEFPVPTSRDRDGNVVITFKQFGVGLAFTPIVLDKNHISLQVSTEVSELTNVGSYTLTGSNGQGLTIPGLSVRRAETTVELPSGGSLVIGGLLQQQNKQNLDAFPGLKELPILGALFRSRDYQANETELVVMVTAYLVDPVSEQKLAGPDDGFVVPTDLETVFMGRLNAVYGPGTHLPPGVPRNAVGYIVQ
jgi:pilus assembly protein CpaC